MLSTSGETANRGRIAMADIAFAPSLRWYQGIERRLWIILARQAAAGLSGARA